MESCTIRLAETDSEIQNCFSVMVQLRLKLDSEVFVERINRQREFGYRLAYSFDDGEVRAVAGFRISECLAWDKYLYVDDLVTNSADRSSGYGDMLFDWLVAYAKEQGCSQFHLHSAAQRFAAHKFYLNKRMKIASHHFSLMLTDEVNQG